MIRTALSKKDFAASARSRLIESARVTGRRRSRRLPRRDLAIGVAWRRRAGRDEASFFVADRSLNTFWGFLGLASLTTGGSTTIALAALVYTHGVSGLWLDLAGALGLLALGLFFARRVRREGAVTLPEILGRYYGAGGAARGRRPRARLGDRVVRAADRGDAGRPDGGLRARAHRARSCSRRPSSSRTRRSAASTRSSAPTCSSTGSWCLGIPVVALACALPGAHGLGGLPPEAWSFPTSATFGAGDVAAMLVLVGLPHLVGSDVYLKLLSCRDEDTARRAALLAAGSKVLFGLSVAAIALAARKALPPVAAVERAAGRGPRLRAAGALGVRPRRARRHDADVGRRRAALGDGGDGARPRAAAAGRTAAAALRLARFCPSSSAPSASRRRSRSTATSSRRCGSATRSSPPA